MNKMNNTAIAASIALVNIAQMATANPTWYYGIGFTHNDAYSYNGGNISEGEYTSLDLLVAVDTIFASAPNLGLEAIVSFSDDNTMTSLNNPISICGVFAVGPYQCGVDKMLRLRATYAFPISNTVDINLAWGGVFVDGMRSTSPVATTGTSLSGISRGIGVTFGLGNQSVRIMYNEDEYGDFVGSSTDLITINDSLSVTYVRPF